MSKRLSSKVVDASPKSKGIIKNDLKTREAILKDDFTNLVIDHESDFVNLQELKFPNSFENKKKNCKKKRAINILKIVENSESSSDDYETFVNPKDDPLRMTPISVKRKL